MAQIKPKIKAISCYALRVISKSSRAARYYAALLAFAFVALNLFFPVNSRATSEAANAWPRLDEIGASSYIVADADTGTILLDHNSAEIAYPASMTKILTALTVLEAPDYDPDKPVHFSELACAMPAAESATAGFLPGEICSTLDCLYAMMTCSANEVANALAETYGGSLSNFVEQMNAKAKELGCENTNFVDPCGFGYIDHHTTAQDLFKIIQRAMKHELFRQLVSCKQYSLPPTNLHPMSGWSSFFNSNYLMVFADSGYKSPYLKSIDGVKTGNTDLAGDCLAAAATTTDGKHLISIIFKAYFAGQSQSFVGPAIMSHTLLEEGAKRLGSPPTAQPQAAAPNASWANAEQLARPTNSSSPEVQAISTYTQVLHEASTAAPDPTVLEVKRWQLSTLIIFLALFLLSTLLLGYNSLLRRRKRHQRPYIQ